MLYNGIISSSVGSYLRHNRFVKEEFSRLKEESSWKVE